MSYAGADNRGVRWLVGTSVDLVVTDVGLPELVVLGLLG